ncbi:hypothetical protein ASD8599_02631 [Ascidiaceihabitans donghaensis]|uniref:Uncharacterized protein n=1 Tax=Ascidiaceihabitans donghaensis TaxID=1510460 RepID=A0A2R8BFU9_9RHOB|nr:hypothetical protein [Ascidiaceihabitans donghaensis]SPH21880.1 hypothetical protein ASD8599_02631 [Ascidiaceihabitans donghaensis]
MALSDMHRPSAIHAIGSFFTSIFNALIDARMLRISAEARAQKIEILNSKSDAELAEMHLRRDDIPAYVFRDLMYS